MIPYRQQNRMGPCSLLLEDAKKLKLAANIFENLHGIKPRQEEAPFRIFADRPLVVHMFGGVNRLRP
jgi:hypothetical protein